eukprot:TRINITY_DN50677_c1_g3_i1.p1 TRINITY_DN50677_c1_g3~~TRINITY_DN50677_c1_g3_i1.p1  ORF type:complete len:1292 (+),score=270.31 TRINITY_DN50677_c1_g3_i1:78-3953(+)
MSSSVLVCPEFLPALARLFARSGLSLSVVATAASSGERGKRDLALASARGAAERYAAEVLLRQWRRDDRLPLEPRVGVGSALRPLEPRVAEAVQGLDSEELNRLLVPGALLLGIDPAALKASEDGSCVLEVGSLAMRTPVAAERVLERRNVVVRDIVGGGAVPGRAAGATVLVEAVELPVASAEKPSEQAAAEAGEWASALCRRYSGAAFVESRFHQQVVDLLSVEMAVMLTSLSCRSGESRGTLSAALVAQARRSALEEPTISRTTVCRIGLLLALASTSAPIAADAILSAETLEDLRATASCSPLLLLAGRDAVSGGALAAGAIVQRDIGQSFVLSFGGGCTESTEWDLRQLPQLMNLEDHRIPSCGVAVDRLQKGSLLTCLLLESGPARVLSPSLKGSSYHLLEEVLSRQVGLRSLQMNIPDGGEGRIPACRSLLQACGASIQPDFSRDGRRVQIAGKIADVNAAELLIGSLRCAVVELRDRVAWHLLGKGGSGMKQLEQEAGGHVRLYLYSDTKPQRIELFGESSAVGDLERYIHEQYAYESVQVPTVEAERILGSNNDGLKELEHRSGGASAYALKGKQHCKFEFVGPLAAVVQAVKDLQQMAAKATCVEIPQRLLTSMAGRLQTEFGLALRIVVDADPCLVALEGGAAAVAAAQKLLENTKQQHTSVTLEVPCDAASHVVGRGGAGLREIAAATGASLRVASCRQPCLVEIFGDRIAVDCAAEALQKRMTPVRLRIKVPRHLLSCITGRNGESAQQIEAAASGAWLSIDMQGCDDAGVVEVEAVGDEEHVQKAHTMIRSRLKAESIPVSPMCLEKLAHNAGSRARAITAATGACIVLPDCATPNRDPVLEVFGDRTAKDAVRQRVKAVESGESDSAQLLQTLLTLRKSPEAEAAGQVVAATPKPQASMRPELACPWSFTGSLRGASSGKEYPRSVPEESGEQTRKRRLTSGELPPRKLNATHADGIPRTLLESAPERLLQGVDVPQRGVARPAPGATVPWAWTLPLSLESPPKRRRLAGDSQPEDSVPRQQQQQQSRIYDQPSGELQRQLTSARLVEERAMARSVHETISSSPGLRNLVRTLSFSEAVGDSDAADVADSASPNSEVHVGSGASSSSKARPVSAAGLRTMPRPLARTSAAAAAAAAAPAASSGTRVAKRGRSAEAKLAPGSAPNSDASKQGAPLGFRGATSPGDCTQEEMSPRRGRGRPLNSSRPLQQRLQAAHGGSASQAGSVQTRSSSVPTDEGVRPAQPRRASLPKPRAKRRKSVWTPPKKRRVTSRGRKASV